MVPERNKPIKEKTPQVFKVLTQNRFENLIFTNDTPVLASTDMGVKCDLCGCVYTSITVMETHKRNSHGKNKRSREGEEKTEDKTTVYSQLEAERKEHMQTKKAFVALEKNTLSVGKSLKPFKRNMKE